MLVKRKRSDSELSCSSASTLYSPPRSQSHSHKAPAHLNSRTLKRHRDNRPSEDQVYEHTLHLLYSAQQPQAHPSRPCAPAAQTNPNAMQSHLGTQQSSLHKFWALPGNSRVLPTTLLSMSLDAMSSTQSNMSPNCAECGLDAPTTDMMDDGMIIDSDPSSLEGAINTHGSCSRCDRIICQQCSISNLDEQRICLSCTRSLQKSRAPLSSLSSFFSRH